MQQAEINQMATFERVLEKLTKQPGSVLYVFNVFILATKCNVVNSCHSIVIGCNNKCFERGAFETLS